MKICTGCKQEIDDEKERYTHVEDYNKLTLDNESWWHLKCFGKAMNRDLTQLEKKACELLYKANTVFNNLPDELKQQGGTEVVI